MEVFTEHVIKIIQAIPDGRVMTYGQIAKVAGKPRAARQVSWILHSMSGKYKLPWHRVINAKGEISLKGSELEGVYFNKMGKVNLDTYLWLPEEEEIPRG